MSEDGWIKHDGKGMPVDGKTEVFVRFSDGHEVKVFAEVFGGPEDKNCWWSGKARYESDNIVAYKVVS